MTPQTEELYTRTVLDSIKDGLGPVIDLSLYKGEINPIIISMDRLWSQMFYGIFVYKLKDQTKKVKLIQDFVTAINNMLYATKGIILRDVTPETLSAYERGDTALEASKDQVLGLVTCLLMMYKATTHEIIKNSIRTVAHKINNILTAHNWTLYNPIAHRNYNSANYCQIHYWGISAALTQILEVRSGSVIEIPLTLIGNLFVKANLEMVLNTKQRKYWWQNIKCLMKYPWYGDYFRAGMYDFNINLCFAECLIRSMISERDAKWVKEELEKPVVFKCNNLNLAFLYFFIHYKHGWLLNPNPAFDYYTKLVNLDDMLHRELAIPNSLTIESPWFGQFPLWSHEIYDWSYFNNMKFIVSPTAMADITKRSFQTPVECSNGMLYLARNLKGS